MNEKDLVQFATDTKRLLIASLSNGEGLFGSDEQMLIGVEERCKKELGERLGRTVCRSLLFVLPDISPELFPGTEGL